MQATDTEIVVAADGRVVCSALCVPGSLAMPRARSARPVGGIAKSPGGTGRGAHRTPSEPIDSRELLDELSRLRDQLDQVTSQLEHTERLATLGTIAGLIAHEFNNILTPVMSYAQMALADQNDSQLAQKALSRALSGSERASKIASAILDFARDEGPTTRTPGRLFHVEQPGTADAVCRVAQIVDDTIACLGRHPARDGITLELDIPADLNVAMRPVALQHVLLNLVLNSRNAMIPGGGTLVITARASAGADPGTVELTIQDTGKGMSPEQLQTLFVPFAAGRRGVEAAAGDGLTEHKSTGLGMTICKRLVEDAGGGITVVSQVGDGTCVRLRLPMHT